jgi:hypothetical protein
MGHATQPMNAARMAGYLSEKAPVISDTYKSPASCYIDYVVLPVTLAAPDARLLANGNAEVFWETSSEANCKEFEVHHGTDNRTWKTIGTVAGNGDSNILRNYTLKHLTPAYGLNYYRLWQVDFNGSRRQFGPAVLNMKNKKGFDVIAVTADKAQKAIVNIYDIQGHLLHSRQLTVNAGFNKFNFITAQLRGYKGEIIIQIKTDQDIERTFKQIVQ